jgi:cob(I)alamin adenosyltransferase
MRKKQIPWKRGYVQVYTGDGKGKTTAALGLALRAAGAGLRVFIGQFGKGVHYSELDALERFQDLITIKQFGRRCFVHGKPHQADIDAAKKGFAEARKAVLSGEYDVVILDEANIAVHFGLFSEQDLLALIDAKPEHVELIITGRKAPKLLIDRADLVTEMKEIKHYYAKGVGARKGIES